MPADVGEMLYTGETSWHGQGLIYYSCSQASGETQIPSSHFTPASRGISYQLIIY
jgi:hypothetical protein